MKNAEPERTSSHPSLVIATFLLVCFAGFTAQAQNPPGHNIKRDLEMLEFIRKTISETYYDKNYRGIDLDAIFKSYAEKLKKSQSDQESLTLIAAAVIELDDSHTIFLPPSFDQRVDYGWVMKMVGDSCVVTLVKPQSDAEKQGLKAGDVVLSIDGMQTSRSSLWKLEYFFRYLNPQKVRQLIVQTAEGKPRLVTITARVEKYRPMTPDEASRYYIQVRQRNLEMIWKVSDEIALWKIPSIEHYEDKDIDQILGVIKGYKKLILDLRGNPGGRADIASSILGCLFSQEMKAYDYKDQKKVRPVRVKPHKKGAFNGELVVLVDSRSGSGAEVIARLIQLEKRGKVIGDRTAGRVMLADTFTHKYYLSPLPNSIGSHIYYGVQVSVADLLMPDGKSLERSGVLPDELLLPKQEDFANKRDPVLARAAIIFGANLDPEKAGALLESKQSIPGNQPKQ
jgi:C-terminal processing protease CtpA/Prc